MTLIGYSGQLSPEPPDDDESVDDEPVDDDPVDDDPVDDEPVDDEPVDDEPVDEPSDDEPVDGWSDCDDVSLLQPANRHRLSIKQAASARAMREMDFFLIIFFILSFHFIILVSYTNSISYKRSKSE